MTSWVMREDTGNVSFDARDAVSLKLNRSVHLILYWRMTSWVMKVDIASSPIYLKEHFCT